MTLWPQILVIGLMVALLLVAIGSHGKILNKEPKPFNANSVIWSLFVFFAVLGAGGFWARLGW